MITRRSFLRSTMLTAAAAHLPLPAFTQVSPGDEVRIGVIGFGGRGANHIDGFTALKGVRLTALCDADRQILGRQVQRFKDKKVEVEGFTDMRKMLESAKIDAVSIATPNHWHALATIWAVQAGKDVYVEKPISHNVWEGRKVVEAARKYNRVVEAGTQSRSSQGIRQAVQWVREGNLGKIRVARGLCYKPRGSIGKVSGPQEVPANIDYDLWCGPAPMKPLMRKKLHYDWHWVWDTGNGDLGNQGIHQMDMARWFLGVDQLSPRVWSVGGRLGYVDDGETANTQMIFHDYPGAPLIFEVRGLPEKTGSKNMDIYKGAGIGVVVECEGGYVVVPDYRSAVAYDHDGKEIKKWSGAKDHFQNFIDVVRSRKMSDLNADIWEGHLSSALCHTGNISYRLDKQSKPEAVKEAIKGDRDASATFERMAAHLAANGVDLEATPVSLGVVLTMDPKVEKFIGNKAADALLTREYRAPYVVPERV